MQRIRRAASLGISPFWVLAALWLAGACSFDWDSLEPRDGASATGGDAQGGAGGTGGGSQTTGGALGAAGSGGTPNMVPACSMSVLANTGFEQTKGNPPRPSNWEPLSDSAVGFEWRSETSIHTPNGSASLLIDSQLVMPDQQPDETLIGTALPNLVPLTSETEVTGVAAVRVEKLAHGSVDLVAHFTVGTEHVHVVLASLDEAAQKFVTVGGVASVPPDATEFGLAFSVPDGALVYVDDACANLD